MRIWLLLAGAVSGAAAPAFGQSGGTYRCVDSNGRSTYTNVQAEMAGKKCTVVSREVSVVPAQVPAPAATAARKPAAPAPASGGSAGGTDRQRILQEELGEEEKRLAEARQQLAQQQAVRSGDERNYQRVLDRLQPYLEAVERHEKNVAQLKRELDTVKR